MCRLRFCPLCVSFAGVFFDGVRMRKLVKGAAFSCAVCALPFAGMAENLVWMGAETSGNLNNPACWNLKEPWGPANAVPGSDDKIIIAVGRPLMLDVTNESDMGVINGSKGIYLWEKTSTCNIVAPEGCDRSITVPIVGGDEPVGDNRYGRLNFTGAGTVRLCCASNQSDYVMENMVIDGTDIWLSQDAGLEYKQYKMGNVTVTNGATLHLPVRHDGSKAGGENYVNMKSLSGDGTVTASEATELRFSSSGGVFSGRLDTDIRIFTSGRQMLTGTNSAIGASVRVYGAKEKWSTGSGVLGVMKFGKTGENSSIGVAGYFLPNIHGGTFLYLGTGEETDKYFVPYGATNGYSVIDAGSMGGLIFTGEGGVCAEVNVGSSAANFVVGLSGSNTTASVFRGNFTAGDGKHLSVIKKGTGTWRFADPLLDGLAPCDYRKFTGSISIDEGVLQFDTIAPPGEFCSVGSASELKGVSLGQYAGLPFVDWAFSLGGTNAALSELAEGTLEYTGAAAGLCDRRLVRLEADGRLRANGAKRIRYRMAVPTSLRAKTLSLDGSSLATNEVHDVTDSEDYPVSVVKEGEGTWLLGGDQSFHGDLKVKGGRLIVRNYEAGAGYTWYRFTIKNLFDPVVNASKRNITMRFLGLFDAEGYCQTLDTQASEDMQAASVEPGEAGYDTVRSRSQGVYTPNNPNNNHNVTNIFHKGTVYDAYVKDAVGGNGYPRIEDPSTWVPFVVRLADGASTVTSYDWALAYGWTSGDKAGFHWTPNVWALEGSVDGIHWENLNPEGGDFSINTNECASVATSSTFVYSGKAFVPNNVGPSGYSPSRHTGGFPIRGVSTNSYAVLSNVRALQVDSGATLELDGVEATFDEIVVDMTKGGGAIKGAALAEGGMVRLENLSSQDMPQRIALDLSGVSGTDNISSWGVALGDTEKSVMRVRYANGALTVYRPGMKICIR